MKGCNYCTEERCCTLLHYLFHDVLCYCCYVGKKHAYVKELVDLLELLVTGLRQGIWQLNEREKHELEVEAWRMEIEDRGEERLMIMMSSLVQALSGGMARPGMMPPGMMPTYTSISFSYVLLTRGNSSIN